VSVTCLPAGHAWLNDTIEQHVARSRGKCPCFSLAHMPPATQSKIIHRNAISSPRIHVVIIGFYELRNEDASHLPTMIASYHHGTQNFGRFSRIITLSGACLWHHPTSRCAWRLHADPRMCMIIIQWASRLTTKRQPNRELGGSR
jgi:hypothetical protein